MRKSIKIMQLGANYKTENFYNSFYGFDLLMFWGVDRKFRNLKGQIIASDMNRNRKRN